MRKVLASITLLVVVGCGVAPIDNRLAVNDDLREACYPVGATDADILAFIQTTEVARISGTTVVDALTEIQEGCGYEIPCVTCLTAVIYQVFAVSQ